MAREAKKLRDAYRRDEDDTETATQSSDDESDIARKDEVSETIVSPALAKAKENGIYKDSSKFNKLIASIFQEEGDYEENPKKIDQPTNYFMLLYKMSINVLLRKNND